MRPPQTGFILVTTVWMLAILTIAAGFFALWTQRALDIAQSLQEDVQGEIDMYNTKSTICYLFSTQRMTIGGLTVPLPKTEKETKSLSKKMVEQVLTDYYNDPAKGTEIVLDDRPYFGQGKAFFAMQDVGGLLNLNVAPGEMISRLLGTLGVAEDLRDPLLAKLQDYMDLDDLHRLNGAESYHYRQAHLPPPTNHYLTNPLESIRILEWDKQPGLWENNALVQLTQTLVSLHPNFNTAPAKVLQAAYNMDAEHTEKFIKLRQTTPFYDLDLISQVAEVNIDMDPFDANYYPADVLRLTLWYQDWHQMRQFFLRSDPKGNTSKPWVIEYSFESKLLPSYTETLPRHAQTTLFHSALSSETP